MRVADLEGLQLGPHPLPISRQQVAFYVEVTGDHKDRWGRHAPPAMAGAALFAVAPMLLSHPAVTQAGGSAIHGEQVFWWRAPLQADQTWSVRGAVERVRHRRGVWFVDFGLSVEDEEGNTMVEGDSSFLIAGGRPPARGGAITTEPGVDDRAENQPATVATLPEVGGEVPDLAKSASRADLVRYAAATGDWNPIHWDHQSAVDAGLPGVVVHGLACAAWLCQGVTRLVDGNRPLRKARIRFRKPLQPGVGARITGKRTGENRFSMKLESQDNALVTAALETGIA